jgi:hypothetical protein
MSRQWRSFVGEKEIDPVEARPASAKTFWRRDSGGRGVTDTGFCSGRCGLAMTKAALAAGIVLTRQRPASSRGSYVRLR